MSYYDRLLDPLMRRFVLLKGDKPGHEFHGNQHTKGTGSGGRGYREHPHDRFLHTFANQIGDMMSGATKSKFSRKK